MLKRTLIIALVIAQSIVAQSEKTVVYSFAKAQKTDSPKLIGGDSITFRIVDVNPIAWDHEVKREEKNINPLNFLPAPLLKVFGQFGLQVSGLAETDLMSGNPEVIALGRQVISLSKEIEAKLVDFQSGPTLVKIVILFPVATRTVTDRTALASDLATLRADFDRLRVPIVNFRGRAAEATKESARIRAANSAAAAVLADLDLIDIAIAEDVKVLAEYAVAIDEEKTSGKLDYYDARLKALDSVPFVEALGSKPTGQYIHISITRKINPDIQKQLEEAGLKDDPLVKPYLADVQPVTKEFQMFVESKLPVVFHVGYGYTRIQDIEYDRLPDPKNVNQLILGRKSEAKATNTAVAFISYPIKFDWKPKREIVKKLFGDLGFAPTFGTQLTETDEKARNWYFGGSLFFAERFFLTAGTAWAERKQLRAGATEGMPLAAGAELPVQFSRALKFFFSISIKPY